MGTRIQCKIAKGVEMILNCHSLNKFNGSAGIVLICMCAICITMQFDVAEVMASYALHVHFHDFLNIFDNDWRQMVGTHNNCTRAQILLITIAFAIAIQ